MISDSRRSIRERIRTRGQATVELALVITFVFLILIGVADVARIDNHLTPELVDDVRIALNKL